MKRTFREPCGCTWRRDERDREAWSELCPAHKAEAEATHDRWAADRHQRVITGTGNAAERRELDALIRALKVLP